MFYNEYINIKENTQMEKLLEQYKKKQALRDKYLKMVFEEKESLMEESDRTGRSIAHIQYTRNQFMRKAMDRQEDMDRLAEKMEAINK